MSRNFNDWLKTFLEWTEETEAPRKMRYWSGIATIAGALKRNVKFPMGKFSFHPNFYIVLVAPAGVATKSTTLGYGMELLEEVPGIYFGPSTGTWQGMVASLSENQEMVDMGDGAFMNSSSITVAASELGSFLSGRNPEQIDVLTDLWDGKGKFDKLTLTNGREEIINPMINLIGCTTPSWIASNLSSDFYNWGMASRIIFVYASQKEKRIAYPYKHEQQGTGEIRQALVEDLNAMKQLRGDFRLSADAEKWGEEWYEKHCDMFERGKHPTLQGEMFSGYLSRKQTHLHKTAMALAAARRDEKVITVQEMKDALAALDNIEKDMPLVYQGFHKDSDTMLTDEVLRTLHTLGGKVARYRLYRKFTDRLSSDSFDRILRSLVSARYVKEIQENNTMYVERLGSDENT